jgi:hypothetical protein
MVTFFNFSDKSYLATKSSITVLGSDLREELKLKRRDTP